MSIPQTAKTHIRQKLCAKWFQKVSQNYSRSIFWYSEMRAKNSNTALFGIFRAYFARFCYSRHNSEPANCVRIRQVLTIGYCQVYSQTQPKPTPKTHGWQGRKLPNRGTEKIIRKKYLKVAKVWHLPIDKQMFELYNNGTLSRTSVHDRKREVPMRTKDQELLIGQSSGGRARNQFELRPSIHGILGEEWQNCKRA